MDKRKFIKLSAAMLATPLGLAVSSGNPDGKLRNWAGNYQYSTDRLHPARSVEEVQKLVKTHDKLKVLGTRHCFNAIADSKANLLSLAQMDRVVELDAK